jgi:Tol biopolymer transport system component
VEHPPRRRFRTAGGRRAPAVAALALAVLLIPAFVAGAAVDDTSFVSVTNDSMLANGPSGPGVVVSQDGRYVVFESTADNLSGADNDSVVNLYVRDRQTGRTELVSRATGAAGAAADADSANPAISPGSGRYVAFESGAANLSDADLDPQSDVFLRDLEADTTTLISRAPGGVPADGDSGDPSLSNEAEVIAFESRATNLSDLDNDTPTVTDVYTYDRTSGTMTLVSRPKVSTAPADGSSFDPSISASGRRVAFASDADNLDNDDRDLFTNVYVAEPRFRLLIHASRTATVGSEHHPANGRSTDPALSLDGAHVAFVSTATNLAGGVGLAQVFVRELSANNTKLVSRADGTSGAMAATAAGSPSISSDGRLVSFVTTAANLGEPGVLATDARVPSILGSDAYVRDMAWDNTILISRSSGAGGGPLERDTYAAALAPAGGLLAFVYDLKTWESSPAPDDPLQRPVDVLLRSVLARELSWRDPPVYVPPPDTGGHHGGDGGHTDTGDHSAGGHGGSAAGGHGGHSAGVSHFTLKLGSGLADRLLGTPLHDKLCGGNGDDVISLGGGPDVGYGGACGPLSPPVTDARSWWRAVFDDGVPPRGADGDDSLKGGTGDDALWGGAGGDRLVGGSGNDYLSGGSGDDRLVGGPGRNRIEAGAGSDSVNSANGVREMVDCGFARDRVTADPRDILSGCERVKRVRRKKKKDPIELLPECPGGGHACHEDGGTVVLSGTRRGG